MNCDMCGREGSLFKADVEGSVLNLCEVCSRFGQVISPVRAEIKKKSRPEEKGRQKGTKEEEFVLVILPDYGQIIQRKREQMGITQDDFAKRINEKRAVIHKIETNQFEPSVSLARKIERFLQIRIVAQEEIKIGGLSKAKPEGFTIGDFIHIRR